MLLVFMDECTLMCILLNKPRSNNFLVPSSFHLQQQHVCRRGRPKQRLQLLLQPIGYKLWSQTSVLGGAVRQAALLQRDGVELVHADGLDHFG